MKKFISSILFAFVGAGLLIAQSSGTPSTLRVLTDANGYLVVEGAVQTLPLTSSLFSNTRLKTDADGNLQVVVTGGAGAPSDATYITQTPNASLSAEQPLSALATGILFSTTTTGVVSSLGPILPSANGGTANAFFTVSGPITSAKTFTFPNASSTVLTSNDTVTAAQGGTGNSTYAVGDMLFANAVTPTLARLAAVASGSVLCSAGVNTAPAYCSTPAISVTGTSANVTGVVDVVNGGTGRATSTTAYGVITAGTTATGVQQTTGPGTTGQVLTSNGAAALPTFQTVPSSGEILLYANNGTNNTAAAAVMDSFDISGLTVLDQLEITATCINDGNNTVGINLFNSTGSITLATASSTSLYKALVVKIFVSKTTNVGTLGNAVDAGVASLFFNAGTFTFTNDWTIQFRHGGILAGDTNNWRWAIHKKVGQ